MSWVILTGRNKDIDHAATPHKIINTKDYLKNPGLFQGMEPKVINLSNSYAYQTRGYYASLLASSRGHKVIPSVETMIDLSARKLYENALPELEEVLNSCLATAGKVRPKVLTVFFGMIENEALARFGKLLYDWFRAPALTVHLEEEPWARIKKIAFLPLPRMEPEQKAQFLVALDKFTGRQWRDSPTKTPARYSFAVLVDPQEAMPPSSVASLKHWARIAAGMGVEVDPIGKKDLAKLANYDALFIRETTAISNHTYRFARRAEQEGMPVIDDPLSMIRCTNKVYLNEQMAMNKVPVPPTLMIAGLEDLEPAAEQLGFPMVVKVPDSAFSRGVKKVEDAAELRRLVEQWLEDSDLLIAQKFMPTAYDWRVGVLGGEPLFVVQYLMAKKHWQIIDHDRKGDPDAGRVKHFSLATAPKQVIDIAVRAAACIGDGLYGVDLKETSDGIVVIEVNDNPNLDHGLEDAAEKNDVWVRLTQWFLDRLEAKRR
ncbi:MAG TPA: RimK family protein [Planctomycetota bacterium]|nr:RimK family protein [Planctomycetota bacterium]